nr:hypothetical protein [Borreliella lusitaniae]WKC84869.1 hypothetical protein QIA24_00205 [Borreliella lusitaniae]
MDRQTLTESVLNDSSIPTRRATPDYIVIILIKVI